jgi:hypothetical protein
MFYDMKCATPNLYIFFFFLQLDTHDGKAVGEGMQLVIVQIMYSLFKTSPVNNSCLKCIRFYCPIVDEFFRSFCWMFRIFLRVCFNGGF